MFRVRGASSSEGCLLSDVSSLEEEGGNELEETVSMEIDCRDKSPLCSQLSHSSDKSASTHSTTPVLIGSYENIREADAGMDVSSGLTSGTNGTFYPKTASDIPRVGYSARDERISSISFSASLSQSYKPEDSSWIYNSRSISIRAEELYSLDSAIEKIGFGRFQIKLLLIVGLSWLADAMEMMLLSVLSPALKCVWYISTVQEALITTAVFLGMMFGAGAFGWMCDVHGRKRGLYFSIVWVLFFGLLSSQAPYYTWIIILRFLVGFGIGGSAQSVTMATEMLPSSSRGKCIVLLELFWAAGSCFAVLVAIPTMTALNWRWFLGFSTLPLFLFLIFGLWLPESPRYLITVGRYSDAVKVLQRIAKENKTQMPQGQLIVSDIQGPRGRVSDLLGKDWRTLTIMLWAIWFSAAFLYYGVVLLTTETFQSGVNSCYPYGIGREKFDCECKMLATTDYVDLLWTSVAEIPGIIITLLIIERMGRKKVMVIEFLVGCGFMLLMFICTSRAIFVVFIFGARAFITGVFQTAYVYTPEVFPTSVRAVGLGTCSSAGRIGAMITPFVAQVLLSFSFFYAAGVYVLVLVVCVALAALLPIETKGRALEDTTESGSVAISKLGYNRLK